MNRSKRTKGGLIPIRPLVAIVIVSLLLALGSAGLHRMSARRSEVARAEALFDQARSTAIGKGTMSVVLIDDGGPSDMETYLRRVMIESKGIDSGANPFKKPNHP